MVAEVDPSATQTRTADLAQRIHLSAMPAVLILGMAEPPLAPLPTARPATPPVAMSAGPRADLPKAPSVSAETAVAAPAKKALVATS
jgi:hypothetical protein